MSEQFMEAAATVGIVVSIFVGEVWTMLGGVAAILALVARKPAPRRRRVLLGAASVLVGAAALGVFVGSHLHQDRTGTVTERWDRWQTDLASESEPSGFFPARPALVCARPVGCGVGEAPILNSLAFGSGGFPHGIPDERRFLTARIIHDEFQSHPTEDLRPPRDPLRVFPGDEVEIIGVLDNAGTPQNPDATARDTRALLAIPPGNGKTHTILGSVSSVNAAPSTVSDSVTLKSGMPIYLRYKPGTATVTQGDTRPYRLPDQLVTTYDPDGLDRRKLAGRGVKVGCRGPNGILPAGRACAVQYRALFDVRYAATPLNVNGIGGLEIVPFEVHGTVRGKPWVSLYSAPRWGTENDLTADDGAYITLDCVLYTEHATWYHVPDADVITRQPVTGYDTAFIPGRNVTKIYNFPNECIPPG